MPGGSITVRATYNSAGPDITIEVQDDGAGIPADKLRFLFAAAPINPGSDWDYRWSGRSWLRMPGISKSRAIRIPFDPEPR